jgi:hypothetical protein
MKAELIPRQVDSKGRIALDKSYAGSTMLVERLDDGTIVLRPSVTVPTNEAWLWKNKRALNDVQEGLDEARRGVHAEPPNLKAAAKLAAKIKD